MAGPGQDDPASRWHKACLVLALAFVCPKTAGGIVVKAQAGAVRDQWLKLLADLAGPDTPIRRLPVDAAPQRIFGGLDLVATLKAGHPVAEAGLLSQVNGGVVIAAMAERLPLSLAAQIGTVLETGQLLAERDGVQLRSSTRFLLVGLDEAMADEPSMPEALSERMAFVIDLEGLRLAELDMPEFSANDIAEARRKLPNLTLSDEVVEALCQASMALGIHTARACLQACGVARVHAALHGRAETTRDDAEIALQLVLLPRATQLPATEDESDDEQPDQQPPPPDQSDDRPQQQGDDEQQMPSPQDLADMLVETAKALLPADLLERMNSARASSSRAAHAGKAGALQKGTTRGRPVGTRRGELKPGAKLNVVETLRAAAPWQTLRRQQTGNATQRIEVRKQDIRLNRFQQHSETTTIFVVDASGSSALSRLAEAKGAVELLLADCYVRRDQVALIVFRGKAAELILPPTRSLVRAKRALTGMAGGGGTPFCSALEQAFVLALAERRRGRTPVIVTLTDGQANIARDGTPGRPQARADTLHAARAIALENITSLFLDISPRPNPGATDIATAMRARLVPLPYADSAAVSTIVRQETASAAKPGRPSQP